MIDQPEVTGTLAGDWSKSAARRDWLGWAGVMVCLWGTAGGASGRDLWLEADAATATATAKPPGERALHLRAGDGEKPEEELPLQKERTSRFDLYADQTRKKDLLAAGQEGQAPVAKLPPEPSACLVVMDRKEVPSTTDAERFNRTLADEGQEAVIAQRTRLNQSAAEGREVVYRCLKTLVPGQDPLSTLPNTFYKRRVEQRLEILLQNNPGRLQANHRLTVKVLFDGKPLVGAKVFAFRRDGGASGGTTAQGNPAVPITAATSAEGLAGFKVDQNGEWLLRVVHVRSGAERKNNPGGAWESFQAAYTFMTKDAPVVAPVPPADKE